jgi:glycerol uptake facilitator protein
MHPYIAEFVGTALLLLFGGGVVANGILNRTKGHGSGWLSINIGWSIAVFVAVFAVAAFSGAHINPAVSIGLAWAGQFAWSDVPAYVAMQIGGAAFGSMLVWVAYKGHFDATEDGPTKRAVFCTDPAIRHTGQNLATEIIATFALVSGVLFMAEPEIGLGALDALPVALLVLGIGASLGGPTGYAINPARDLGPRLMHALLPIAGKSDGDWAYAWIPVVGPIIGGILAAIVHGLLLG